MCTTRRSVAKSSPSAAQAALQAGYGGAAGALVGAVGETAANALVKDVTFVIITDIEIAERAKEGVVIRQDSRQDAKQGIGGGRRQTSSEIVDMEKYRTRIVSTANKVNLDYNEAAPALTNGLIRSLSGLF